MTKAYIGRAICRAMGSRWMTIREILEAQIATKSEGVVRRYLDRRVEEGTAIWFYRDGRRVREYHQF